MAMWKHAQGWNIRADMTSCVPSSFTITPGTGAEGAWVDVLSSTMAEAGHFLRIGWNAIFTSGANRGCLLDIAISVGGTRYVVVRQLNVCQVPRSMQIATSSTGQNPQLFFPCYVPSGAQVSIRARGSVATTFTVSCEVWSNRTIGGKGSYAQARAIVDGTAHPDSYGPDTTNFKGVTVVPSASANTFGSTVQIAASTAHPYDGFIIGYGGVNSTSVTTSTAYRIQLCDSAATTIFYDGISGVAITTPNYSLHYPFDRVAWLQNAMPTGTAVYARCMGSIASSSSVSLTLHGLRK